jgi:hypothetical protein
MISADVHFEPRLMKPLAIIVFLPTRVAAFSACLAFWLGLTVAVHAQQPVWGDASEQQIAVVKKIFAKYGMTPVKVRATWFGGTPEVISDVHILEVQTGERCDFGRCYYVMTPDPPLHGPFVTECRFSGANTGHAHHVDGSKIYVFDFSCRSASFQVQISKEHFFVTAEARR